MNTYITLSNITIELADLYIFASIVGVAALIDTIALVGLMLKYVLRTQKRTTD